MRITLCAETRIRRHKSMLRFAFGHTYNATVMCTISELVGRPQLLHRASVAELCSLFYSIVDLELMKIKVPGTISLHDPSSSATSYTISLQVLVASLWRFTYVTPSYSYPSIPRTRHIGMSARPPLCLPPVMTLWPTRPVWLVTGGMAGHK